MRFHIRHILDYRYQKPVFFEPLTILLRPAENAHQRLLNHELTIAPQPAGQCTINDIHNNVAVMAWFNDTCDHLTLTAASTVKTLGDNPFDYLITDTDIMRVPLAADRFSQVFHPYLQRDAADEQVDRFAGQLAKAVDHQTVPFLNELVRTIHQQHEIVIRHEGHAMSPGETLQQKQGACRDLAVLFMDACRSLGLPARFVSGYFLIEPDEPAPAELHAWAQVYLPGAGWRGYDPSAGLATAARHVHVAASPTPAHAMPTQGHYRGTGVESNMTYQVQWQAISA